MSTMRKPTPSPRALEKLKSIENFIRPLASAELLWERLSLSDRKQLGGDLPNALCKYGTVGMWTRVKGVTKERAVVDVAKLIGLLWHEDAKWLLREIGEFADPEEAMLSAIDAGDFVLVENPRQAYWDKSKIGIDWKKYTALWGFLWDLGRRGKEMKSVERITFGDHAHQDVVTKLKSRLTGKPEFPISLADKIQVAGRGAQQLNIPVERIRIFEQIGDDALREWTP